jgi:hypothetical protein
MQSHQSLRFSLLSNATSTRWRKMTMPITSTARTCTSQRHCFSRTLTRTYGGSSSSSNSNKNNNIKEPLRPYSGSLPSPGYEWCQRCNIPSKKLQKAIGQHNPCLDRRPGGGGAPLLEGICPAARHYYQQQFTHMFFFTALCFVALPRDFLYFESSNHDDSDDSQDDSKK